MLLQLLEFKQVIILRKDLKMTKGKAAAQASHAAVASAIKSMRERQKEFTIWWRNGQTKIILAVESEEELLNLEAKLQRTGVVMAKINDAGRTQLPPGTTTALGVGPHAQMDVERITSNLKLF